MLDQPTSTPIKKELALAEEQSRDRVSILEAEASRFERLIMTQKRELISLENTKVDLVSQVEKLSKEIEGLKAEYFKVGEDRDRLLEIIAIEKAEQAKRSGERAIQDAHSDKRESLLDEKEQKMLKEQGFLVKAQELLTAEKDAFAAKVDVLSKALKEIV